MSDAKEILTKQSLFENFNDEEVTIVSNLFEEEQWKKGDTIIEQDGTCNDLYFIVEGTVEVVNNGVSIIELGEREFFGELSFMDEKQRSSSIRTKSDVSILKLSRESLEQIKEHDYLKYKFIAELNKIIIERLRLTNLKSLEEMEKRNRLGQFSIILIIGLSILTCIAGFIKNIRVYVPIYFVTPILLIVFTSLLVKAIKIVGLPLKHFGLTWQNSKKALLEGVVISIGLLLLFFCFKSKDDFFYAYNLLFSGYRGVLYMVVAIVEELMFRGVLQTALKDIYQDEKGYFAIVTTSLFFAVSHVFLGFLLTIASFGAGIFLGLLYQRHQNLIGISIIHYFLGCIAIGFHILGN